MIENDEFVVYTRLSAIILEKKNLMTVIISELSIIFVLFFTKRLPRKVFCEHISYVYLCQVRQERFNGKINKQVITILLFLASRK